MRRILVVFVLLFSLGGPGPCLAQDAGPRAGTYRILSYGAVGKPPLVLGALELDGRGHYRALLPGGRAQGEGAYGFDAATATVTWRDGPYAGVYAGKFESDRGGKTHKIRLKSTTIATNSID